MAPGRGLNVFDVARHIHVSNSHIKFGWISSIGLGGERIMDGWTDGWMNRQTHGWRELQYPHRFLKKNLGYNRCEREIECSFI